MDALTLIMKFVPDRYERIAKQFIKFGLTGSLGAVVDFGSYTVMTRGFGWQQILLVLNYEIIAANLVSVFLAIATMFMINKYWTFRNTDKAVVKQGVGYFSLNFVTFVLNQILTSFFAFRVPIIAVVFGGQKDFIAKALAIGIILFLNFFGSKFLVFRKKHADPVQTVPPSGV